ncbi:hypothetical protein MNBD_GAMMA17-317 [hydrothermal vent metagenome]|uniref:Transposase and inactivated derivatives n=1 Tax=hydrothermal vent metagenome TaxID=652676 RepID=A0A3B0YVL4_9ZZZZ
MSNHYHVVLFVNQPRAAERSINEEIRRWHQLFSANLLSQRYLRGDSMSRAACAVLDDCVTLWRGRLIDIVFFIAVQPVRKTRFDSLVARGRILCMIKNWI